jgi:transcriptional regulator
MQIKPEFNLRDLQAARSIVAAHPFATLLAADLRATHMPCLLDDGGGGELAVVGHVARADPFCDALAGPLLAVFHGPHGYVSASWYEAETISTWNYVIVHLRGTPQVLEDALPVVRRTIDHFEATVGTPWSLDRMSDRGRSMADQVVAFRLVADWWYAEAKLSQDKPPEERARVLRGVDGDPAYANPALAAAMREFGGA